MILRRLTNAFRKQDWFTVAVETLIVVLGVFLGLQVNNWNGERSLKQEQAQYLEQLEAEHGLIETTLEKHVERYSGSVEATRTMLRHLSREEPVDQDLLVELAETIDSYPIPPGSSAALRELISSGKMGLIESRALRTSLMRLNDHIELLARAYDGNATDSSTLLPALQPYLEIDLTEASDASLRHPQVSVVRIDLDGMRADADVATAMKIDLKVHANMLFLDALVLDEVREVRSALEEEIEK
ncbi:hypothetical protein [Hyphomonas sp.]|uniref:hypothetical protein n=1 Tax=Hyphomonas sp. TaxID=87 RepID=UPI0030F7718E